MLLKILAILAIGLVSVWSLGPLSLLQGVASINMVLNYSNESSLEEGISMTMSGDFPCPMCLALQQVSKDSEGSGVFGTVSQFGLLGWIFPKEKSLFIPVMPYRDLNAHTVLAPTIVNLEVSTPPPRIG